MSKKNKGSLVLLAGVLTFGAVGALASCGETTPDQDKTPETTEITKITITNADALAEKWTAGSGDRTISIETDPEVNITQALDNGDIVVTSSDSTVVQAFNLRLKALKAGTATITIAAGDVKAEITITVSEVEKIGIRAATIKTLDELNGGTAVTSKEAFNIDAQVVANSKYDDLIIFDGEDFGAIHDGELCKEVNVGDKFNFTVNTNVYHKGLQLKVNSKKATDKTFTVPEAPKMDYAAFKKMYDARMAVETVPYTAENLILPTQAEVEGTWFSSRVEEAKDKYYAHIKIDGKDWKDEYKLKVDYKNLQELSKSEEYPEGAIEGDKIMMKGFFHSYNGSSKHYSFVPYEAKVLERAIPATDITTKVADTTDNKVAPMTPFKIDTQFLPAKSIGEVEYTLPEGVITRRGSFLAKEAGTYTIKVALKGTEVVKDLKITVEGEAPVNALTTAEPKTIAEMKAIYDKCGTDKKSDGKMYIIKGLVKSAGSSDKGEVVLKDLTTEDEITLKTFGTDVLNVTFKENGSVDRLYSDYNFTKDILGKQFQVGDEVELYTYVNYYAGTGKDGKPFVNHDTNAIYKSTLKSVNDKLFAVTLPDEVTTDTDISKGVKPNTTLVLKYAGDQDVLFNGTIIAKGEDGNYTITTTTADTVITLAPKSDTPIEQGTRIDTTNITTILPGKEFPKEGEYNTYGDISGSLLGVKWAGNIGLGHATGLEAAMQFRTKKGVSSNIENTTAFAKDITKIVITCLDQQKDVTPVAHNVYVSANPITADNLASATKLTATADTTKHILTYTVESGTAAKYVYIAHAGERGVPTLSIDFTFAA